MTVISEKAIRLIIQKKLLKENFFRQSTSSAGEGEVRYRRCDLSGLKNTSLPRTFAKYFLFKPEYQELKDGEVRTFTRSNLLNLLQGGMSDEDSKKYDQLIDAAIAKDPRIIDRWLDLLSFGITRVFGPFSKMYCRLLSIAFLGGKNVTREVESLSQDPASFKLALESSLGEVGKSFSNEKRLIQLESEFTPSEFVLFPKTFMKIRDGEISDAQDEFSVEILKANDLVANELTPKQIYRRFVDIFSGISNKRQILRSFDRYTSSIADTQINGTIIRNQLRTKVVETVSKLQRLHGIT